MTDEHARTDRATESQQPRRGAPAHATRRTEGQAGNGAQGTHPVQLRLGPAQSSDLKRFLSCLNKD